MTLVSWRRPNCHVTECHMTLQVSHDTSVTVTFEVSHNAPPEPVMLPASKLLVGSTSGKSSAPNAIVAGGRHAWGLPARPHVT